MNLKPLFEDLERAPARIAWAYAGAGGAWILVSDSLAAFVQNQPLAYLVTDLLKGLLFIVATASLVFLLIRRVVQRELASRAEIAAAQERFRSAATQFPYALAIFDGESRLVFLNARGTQLTGKPLGELLGRRLDEVLPSPLANACRPMLDRVGRDLRAQSQVLEVPWEDGPPAARRHGHAAALRRRRLAGTASGPQRPHFRGAGRTPVAPGKPITAINQCRQLRADPIRVRAATASGFLRRAGGANRPQAGLGGARSPGEATVRVAAHAGPAAAYLDGIEVRCDNTALGRGAIWPGHSHRATTSLP